MPKIRKMPETMVCRIPRFMWSFGPLGMSLGEPACSSFELELVQAIILTWLGCLDKSLWGLPLYQALCNHTPQDKSVRVYLYAYI